MLANMDEASLKDSLAATFRAIAGVPDAEVKFQPVYVNAAHPILPEVLLDRTRESLTIPLSNALQPAHIPALRGKVDAAALTFRYHDPALHKRIRPEGAAGELLDRLEKVRTQALGAVTMRGVAENLAAKWQADFSAEENPQADTLSLLTYQALTGFSPPDYAKKLIEQWGGIVSARIEHELMKLNVLKENQQAFARVVREIAAKLHYLEVAPGEGEGSEAPQAANSSENQSHQQDLFPTKQVEAAPELPSEGGEAPTPSDFDKDAQAQPMEGEGEEAPSGKRGADPVYTLEVIPPFYEAYTTRYDKIARPLELAAADELAQLRHQLDLRLANLKDVTSRLAARLQRKLMAQQVRSWKFHQEEGLLDAAKLTHIITDPAYGYLYKTEKEIESPNSVVTLLIDNSGSMRGRPITVAALSTDILARTLERCGIKVEILGFSTVEWKGGKSRKLWQSHGSPANPGRLNELLHIIYKRADEPWRMAKRNLGLMLKEGLLKENIDGEALEFAYKRLLNRPEMRKILMVISDGAPVDDSTLSTNSGDYLDRHLRKTIATIETDAKVELLAIGIGHNVNSYYRHAVTLREVEQLGDTMIGELSALFAKPHGRVPLRRRAS